MKEMTEKTYQIAPKFKKQWDSKTRFVDLVEEVGELANALLGRCDDKPQKCIRADIEDSLCDILYDVILLARDFDIDLKDAYLKMLDRLEERLDSGAFED